MQDVIRFAPKINVKNKTAFQTKKFSVNGNEN